MVQFSEICSEIFYLIIYLIYEIHYYTYISHSNVIPLTLYHKNIIGRMLRKEDQEQGNEKSIEGLL